MKYNPTDNKVIADKFQGNLIGNVISSGNDSTKYYIPSTSKHQFDIQGSEYLFIEKSSGISSNNKNLHLVLQSNP